jgi:hypothetical protein
MLPPVCGVPFVGLIATDVMMGIEDEIVIVAELSFTTPFSVALTNKPTIPMVVPAVRFTEALVMGLRLPIALSVRCHE